MSKDCAEYNSICLKCLRKCKQLKKVQILSCPRFDPIPVQMEIKVPGLGMRRAKP